MKSVFLLQHVREKDDENDDVKLVGIYSTRENAENTKKKFLILPGFKDYPDSFFIDEYTLDKDHWEEGFGF